MVLDHAFPPDLRVENEAATLVAAGFEVAIYAVGEDDGPTTEDRFGVRIFRFRLPDRVRNKLRGLAGTIPAIEWVLGKGIRRIYSMWPFDALHAHDLYLFGTCLRAGRRLGVRVVGDMHENWVHALSVYHWSTHYPGRALINLAKWDRLETEWSHQVDCLILVIDEMKERMRLKGIDPGKMIVVPNTIQRDHFDQMLGQKTVPTGDPGALRLIYTGGMDRHRGLSTIIAAMPELLKSVPNVSLTLVGDGAIRDDLERLSVHLGVSEAVSFEGQQPQDRIPDYIRAADIGLIPHLKSVHTDNTIPHKLFHYMHMGLPVVASDCAPLRRIVEGEEAGVIYPSGDAAALAEAVIALAADEKARNRMGESGKRAVAERYNWQATAEILVSTYARLLG